MEDGSLATDAAFSHPERVFVDSAGNIFIADSGNNRIRKVDGATGIITTVAGNGKANGEFGFTGDGGPATEAVMNSEDVFVDSTGNIFIADSANNRIRKVDGATGIITTVAGNGGFNFDPSGDIGDGGLATEAAISPSGVFVDSAGNIFIADSGNNRIRKVEGATGIITTVAGFELSGFSGDGGVATEAALSLPEDVFVDSAGNIFILERGNFRIRKVDGATGIITTVAGNGELGFSGDGGPATEATFDCPLGVFVDSAGNIFIADGDNNRIRKVSFDQDDTDGGDSDDDDSDDDDDVGGKSFTFNCEHSMKRGFFFGLETLTMKVGDTENCILRLTNHEAGKEVNVATNLLQWFGSAVEIEPEEGITDQNGELAITLTAVSKGINWAAWAVPNDKGQFRFNKKTYDSGLAWGMFVEVK